MLSHVKSNWYLYVLGFAGVTLMVISVLLKP